MRGWRDRVSIGEPDAGAAAQVVSAAPTLRSASYFGSGSQQNSTYWLMGSAQQPTPSLYLSSGAQVCHDVRSDLGLSTDTLSWNQDMLARLAARIEEIGRDRSSTGNPVFLQADQLAEEIRGQSNGALLRLAAIKAGVWFSYGRSAYPEGPMSVLLPEEVGVPRVGQALTRTDMGETRVVRAFNANSLSPNPFSGDSNPSSQVYNPWRDGLSGTGDVTDSRGTVRNVNRSGKPDGVLSGGGGGIALVALALFVAVGTDK